MYPALGVGIVLEIGARSRIFFFFFLVWEIIPYCWNNIILSLGVCIGNLTRYFSNRPIKIVAQCIANMLENFRTYFSNISKVSE